MTKLGSISPKLFAEKPESIGRTPFNASFQGDCKILSNPAWMKSL